MNISGDNKRKIAMTAMVVSGVALTFPNNLPGLFDGNLFGNISILQVIGAGNLLGAYWIYQREMPP